MRQRAASVAFGLSALLAFGGCVAKSPPVGSPEARDARPNIVVVITDDQGIGDFGGAGNPVIDTPHLDAMARRGGQLTTFYVSPVCAPTRASLMTGRYNYRTRVVDTYLGRAMMEPDEVTLAEVLRDAGYATGLFGKWHLGDNYPMRPQDQGFDEVLMHRGGGIGQPSDPPEGRGRYTDPVLQHDGVQKAFSGYCTDVYFDHALAFIEESHRAGERFFAYVATNAPHGPFHDVPESLYEKYRARDLSPVVLSDDPDELDRTARVFAMVENIDENVGRLFERLDALDAARDTIVVFLTDNGPNGRRWVRDLRGRKSDVTGGGIRTALFFHWPGRVQAGWRSDEMAAHIDLMPTLLDAAGVPPPSGVTLDGRSVLPWLLGRTAPGAHRFLFTQAHRGDTPVRYHHVSIQDPRWKLVNASGFGSETMEGEPRFALYDLAVDPSERDDVSDRQPAVVARMRDAYDAWFDDVGRTRPDNFAKPRIVVGSPHENPTVLTRQDWIHLYGLPWGADSNGRWSLRVEGEGLFDVVLRLEEPSEADGRAVLEVGGRRRVRPFAAGTAAVRFEGIALPAGVVGLVGYLAEDPRAPGPWQVDVLRVG